MPTIQKSRRASEELPPVQKSRRTSEELQVANDTRPPSNRQQKFTVIPFDQVQKARGKETETIKEDITSGNVPINKGLFTPKPNLKVCKTGEFTLIWPVLMYLCRMLMEIMVIYSTTLVVWIVIEHKSVTHGECDLALGFNNAHLVSPHPMLTLDCDDLPSSAAFVSFWSQWQNVTGLNTDAKLAALIEDISENFCDKAESQINISVFAALALAYTVIIFGIKYHVDNTKERAESIGESKPLSEMHRIYWRLFLSNWIITLIALAFFLVLLLVTYYPYSQNPIAAASCLQGADSEFAVTCFKWFSLGFAVFTVLTIVALCVSWRLFYGRLLGLQQHPDLKGKHETEKRSKWTHETEPFFAVFGPAERYRYDKTTFTLYFWDKKNK